MVYNDLALHVHSINSVEFCMSNKLSKCNPVQQLESHVKRELHPVLLL